MEVGLSGENRQKLTKIIVSQKIRMARKGAGMPACERSNSISRDLWMSVAVWIA